MHLFLTEPTKVIEAAAMAYRESFIKHGETHINGSGGFIHFDNYDEWLKRIAATSKRETSFFNVPATTFFTIRKTDGKIVGSIQLRHELTEDLRKIGGHIGYGICPDERRKGYGREQLALVLEKAKLMCISRVMITCDKENIASEKVALQNGGILECERFDEKEGYIKIYWIELS